ncbi:hypothetical protein GTQ99_08400, partial [Kineococcus sp. T13]
MATDHLSEDRAVDVALGEQPGEEERTHLAGCARCREEVEGWSSLGRTARSEQRVEPVAVPAGTWAAVARAAGVSADPRAASSTGTPTGTPDGSPSGVG